MPMERSEEDAVKIKVNAEDEADGKEDKKKEDTKKGKKDNKKKDEMSEEDKALKEGLELAVTRLSESDQDMHEAALGHLIKEVRSATSSMTSVPKPLKFLRPHYDTLKSVYSSWPESHSMKQKMADILSVLAMTMAQTESRESLKFKLDGTKVDISAWGHEYVRSLSGEIAAEYNQRALESENDKPNVDDLLVLVDDIVPFQMKHNAEAEAADLLMEVQQLGKLLEDNIVDERNYERVCLYLLRAANYMVDPDDLSELFMTAYKLYTQQGKFTDALRVALKIDDSDLVNDVFKSAGESDSTKKQLCFVLAHNRSPHELEGEDELNELIGNGKLSEIFLAVAADMNVSEPKTPEDIFKSHLAEGGRSLSLRGMRGSSSSVLDSARANLASSIVNGFVNAGFGKDKLMTEENSKWVYKNKEHGMTSATASLGLLMLWNIEEGLNQVDKYLYSDQEFIKAGACLAIGIMSTGVRNESDPAFALLSEYIDDAKAHVRISAMCGLGIAYVGQMRPELTDMLGDKLSATDFSEVALAGLSLGMANAGSCDDESAGVLIQRLMEATETELDQSISRFLCLGLGLLFLGSTERCEPTMEALKTIEHKRARYAEVVLETCAYAGSGNVLKVQQMLRICAEHISEPKDGEHQAAAVLGIALTVLGEDIGTEMSLRTFDHLLHYGELVVRRVVPLGIALLYLSNPDYAVIEQLSRLSHDADSEIAQNAIFGLGLVSAGTNNSRVAGLLRQLSEFYAKDAPSLFVVRMAQGLLTMGKGLVSISPFQSDRFLMTKSSLAGILVVLHCCLDMKHTILDKHHYLLYFIAPAIYPRYMCAVDAELNLCPATVRVGQAVETVGQAGRPKTITGFQTHTSPVLLGFKDRAELGGAEFSTSASVLEGVIIVDKVEEEKQSPK
jgi:26S proteasome regulatory subunit N1